MGSEQFWGTVAQQAGPSLLLLVVLGVLARAVYPILLRVAAALEGYLTAQKATLDRIATVVEEGQRQQASILSHLARIEEKHDARFSKLETSLGEFRAETSLDLTNLFEHVGSEKPSTRRRRPPQGGNRAGT